MHDTIRTSSGRACAVALFGLASSPIAAAGELIFFDGFETQTHPVAGAVIFTEILSNPTAVADSAGEWFELASVANRPVQIEGCTVGNGTTSAALPDQLAGPGWIGVVARSLDSGSNGGVVAFATFGFTLGASGMLELDCDGRTIDTVSWTSEVAGSARSLDSRLWDAQANDADASWCTTTQTYNGVDNGTPGQLNPFCTTVAPAGPRPIAGEVRINEWMVDPAVLDDASAEWVELKSLTAETRDLDGCIFSNGITDVAVGSVPMLAGAFALFGRSADSGANGGLAIDQTFGFSLTNGSGTILLKCDDTVIDQVSWSSSTSGFSLQRDLVNPTLICTTPAGAGTYTASNVGTPRAENVPCP